MSDPFDQPYRVRLGWGRRGARNAALRGDACVIVDVLRFSTAIVAAASRGVCVVPAADTDDLRSLAVAHDATILDRASALAPTTYLQRAPGDRVIVCSPNGATCARLASNAGSESERAQSKCRFVAIGALVNASAVGRFVARHLAESHDPAVTIIACGERWNRFDPDDGNIRFAIEDYLGAGAILSALDTSLLSPEAAVCAGAFRAAADRLPALVTESGSGRELLERGDPESIGFSVELDRFPDVVPLVRQERIENATADRIAPGQH